MTYCPNLPVKLHIFSIPANPAPENMIESIVLIGVLT